jgi:hypothetical protein
MTATDGTWLSRLAARRRSRHWPPYSEAEFELLSGAKLEARALRRRRTKLRRLLVKGSES